MGKRSSKVSRAQTKKLLSGIEVVSILRGEGTCRGNALDVGEHQATCCKRNDPLHVPEAQRWTIQCWQAGRNVFSRRNAYRGKSKRHRRDNRQRDYDKGDRTSG